MREKKNKEEKVISDKKPNKFVQTIKKKWLINGTKTLLLVAIIIVACIAINIGVEKLELSPIDFSKEKIYTLTDESKEKIKNIDKEISMYFVGFSDNDQNLEFAKQYNKVNEKITAQAVDISQRPDLANKYGIEEGTEGIIIECGEKSKVLTSSDLYTYDMTTYEEINIAEERFTSSLISVSSEKVPKVYFLEGYSELTLDNGMYLLNTYLENEINEVSQFNMITTGKVPDDCDTLVIVAPTKDFDEMTTTAIKDYINAGGNILWLNSAMTEAVDMPNINNILELYAIKPFEPGIIYETDANKMLVNYQDLIIPDIQYSEITENSTEQLFLDATKINIDTDKLDEMNVIENDLLLASETSFFRSDFTKQSTMPLEDEEKGTFVIGCELDKTINEGDEETGEGKIESKLIIYGDSNFASDAQPIQNLNPLFVYNKDLVLNSIAYLSDREEDITARKSTGNVSYVATEQQDNIVRAIIFTVPVAIMLAGLAIWQMRRRKK